MEKYRFSISGTTKETPLQTIAFKKIIKDCYEEFLANTFHFG